MERRAKPTFSRTTMSIIAIGILCGGCLGRSPEVRRFVLGATEAAVVDGKAPKAAIVVGPVRLPAYLERPQIARLRTGGEIELDQFNRWLGGFEENFLRALSLGLARELGSERVVSNPTRAPFELDYRIRLHVDDMIMTDSDGLRVRVRWALVPIVSREAVDSEAKLFVMDERFATKGRSAAHIVHAYDEAIEELVRRISGEIAARQNESH